MITSKEQLLEWRQGFAESLRVQGVEAEATPALSRGSLSQNTELRSKKIIEQRGQTLSSQTRIEHSEQIQNSIDRRMEAWNRIHHYMQQHSLDGANELENYIKHTCHQENLSLEQDL